jgi:hypothetical protein
VSGLEGWVKADLRTSYGIEVQLRAIALPQLSAGGGYNAQQSSLTENFPSPLSSYIQFPNQNWNADIKVWQSVYAGALVIVVAQTPEP